MKRYKKPDDYKPILPTYDTSIVFNLLKKLAIYGRQSTKNQVHKRVFSREMQTEVLIAKGIALGWPEDAIILYIENLREDGTVRAASGRLRIDEREGLSALVERIENNEVSAVMVSRVDRLFRDETEIEPNKFILICKVHKVYVITLERTYNFANPDDADLFREKCRQAAAELRTQRERLGGPKDLAAQAGFYDGRALCPGFFIGFYLVSDVTPEGEPIDRKTRKRYIKQSTSQCNPRPNALLEGVIESPDERKAVYVHEQYANWYYAIVWRGALEGTYPEKFSMLVSQVDALFMDKIQEHLAIPTDLEELRQLLAVLIQNYRQAREDAVTRLEEIHSQMQVALASLLDKSTLPATRKALNQVYAELAAEQEELEASLTPKDDSEEAQVIAYHEKLQQFNTIYDISFADMQMLVKAMVKTVRFEGLSCHFMRLHVTWRSPQWEDEEAIIWRINGRAPLWTEEEIAIILDCYPTLGQLDLMEKLPRRTWFSIKMKASKEGVTREVRTKSEIQDINLSLEDIRVIDEYRLSVPCLVSSDICIYWCRPTKWS